MRVHVLQHVEFEGLGSIAAWLAQHHARVSYTHFFAGDVLPASLDFDLLIVLGGPMSVHDSAQFPWLRAEQQFLRLAMQQQIAILGICLGAQLLAAALGARVENNAAVEIGWLPVECHAAVPFNFPASVPVLHWHGETFTLPDTAHAFASSARCRNQAFQIGTHIIGLQFHLEANAATVAQLLQHCAADLARLSYPMSAAQLQQDTLQYAAAANACMVEILQYLTRR
jgi:GMP synthase-like glutamine amidotransferase